jgi:hypothetical protein
VTYLEQAHGRLLAFLAREQPAVISTFPTSEEFEAQKAHLETVASLIDGYIHAIAVDAAYNCTSIKSADFTGVVSTALHDLSLTSQFTEAAEALREDEPARSDFKEHNTHSFAMSGAK